MRLIDRLQQYLSHNQITPYAFERACDVSNGYLGKQLRGRGAVGSDILERIKENYTDLSLVWLVTGKGSMLLTPPDTKSKTVMSDLNEEQHIYFTSKDDIINLLNKQIAKLEATIADKNKIIHLLEEEIKRR